MRMITLSCLIATFFVFCQCTNQKESGNIYVVRSLNDPEQEARNEAAREEARKMVITDETFLQTSEPINDDVIQMIDLQTFEVGNHARDNRLYMEGIKRIEKNLKLVDGRMVVQAKSGKELNMAEDMFQFISKLVEEWNGFVEQGFCVIEPLEGGGYTLGSAPREQEKKE